MIETVNKAGATVSTDIENSDEYVWTEEGRLMGIYWAEKGLSSEIFLQD